MFIANSGLGQILMFNPKELPGNAPSIAAVIFAFLKEADKNSSVHTKPVTTGCEQAILVRVRNDKEIGVPLSTEIKSRMFLATDIEDKPIIIACHYLADSTLDNKKLASLLPKDSSGRQLIKLPYTISARANKGFDPADENALESPFTKASEISGLGMGQINPASIIYQSKVNGFRLLNIFDSRFATKRGAVTTNAGHRTLGTFTPNGEKYCELAIATTPKLHIAGNEYDGHIVGNFAKQEVYKEPPILAQLYNSGSFLEKALVASYKDASRA